MERQGVFKSEFVYEYSYNENNFLTERNLISFDSENIEDNSILEEKIIYSYK